MKSVSMILFLMLFFLGVLIGCPEKKLTPDPAPVDPPQVRLTYDRLMGFEGRMAPRVGPAYTPLFQLAGH